MQARQRDTPHHFTVPSWTSAPPIALPYPDAARTDGDAIMHKIETLEQAKRRAAESYTRMCSSSAQADMMMVQATTRDEQDVLKARVDVLNTLMRAPDARLCLESGEGARACLESGEGARVCVTYDRMRCEGEMELGPMQSTMSWAVRGGEDPILHLLSAGDNGAHAPVVKGLLDLVRESAPRKDVLRGLHEVLSLPAPERLVLKSVVGLNSSREDHTRVVEGLGEGPLYRITWGALDLDVLEGWQNPSTNAAIRLSILDTAHQAVREAERTKAPAWSNVTYMQARIFHGDECHVLNLRPFWDSESCTVSHLQYRQSVFDDSGPERGILNLAQDPGAIHAIPLGKILPIRAYVCLGAHRKSRLNEAQLNYVHAQGLLAHGFDPKLLPEAESLVQQQQASLGKKMVPAKSTRVSAERLDVMASSYHVADQVYTTISVVQYPPFGTQFSVGAAKKTRVSAPTEPEALPFVPGREEHVTRVHPIPGGARPPLRDGEIPLYKQGRDFEDDNRVRSRKELSARRWKKDFWNADLRDREHFFIDGVVGDPYVLSKRFILFELDNGTRYKKAEEEMASLKTYFKDKHSQNWDSQYPFYINIFRNTEPGTDEATIGEVWRDSWQDFISKDIIETMKRHDLNTYEPDHFWYTADLDQWDTIITRPDVCRLYKEFSHRYFQKLNGRHPTMQARLNARRLKIPLPPFSLLNNARKASQADPTAALHQLQTRIDALETRLSRVRQEENTKHLLEQVLDRLDERQITEV